MENKLEVNNLYVSFPFIKANKTVFLQAVRGLSFSLEKGKVLGIVGESGSGKSVSTSAIMGLLPAYAEVEGEILFDGINVLELSKKELREYRGKKIGMIFQEPARSFDPLQNIFSVFYETLKNSNDKITKEEAFAETVNLLKEVGLKNIEDRLKCFPHQFSGGQLQRIGIALALAQGCDLLIADEPTTALDVTIQAQIISLLKRLQKTRNLTVIFISHNIDLVASIADKILVMYGGMLMEENLVKEIMENPQHPYTQALLNASPKFGMHYSEEKLKFIPGKVVDPIESISICPFFSRCEKKTELCEKIMPEIIEQSSMKIRCNIQNLNGEKK